MNCLKCGREVPGEQTFCEDCRLDMEKYPVKPGTPIQLPKHRADPPKKTQKRKSISAEEQVKQLKKHIRFLTLLLVLMTLLVMVMSYPTFQYLLEDHFLPGQNYTTIVNTSANMETTAP